MERIPGRRFPSCSLLFRTRNLGLRAQLSGIGLRLCTLGSFGSSLAVLLLSRHACAALRNVGRYLLLRLLYGLGGDVCERQ